MSNSNFHSLFLIPSSIIYHHQFFIPPNNYLIDCGGNADTIVDNRNFIGDETSLGSNFLSATKTIIIKDQNPSLDSSPLYHTARVFTRLSSYDFKIKRKGLHLVHFHFFPFPSTSYNLSNAVYLTDKSDVYLFGVLLIEVLCARSAVDPVLSRDEVNLAEWAMEWQKKGLLEQSIGRMCNINPTSLKRFGETAMKCLADYGVDRPTMGDVLWNLEYALQLQEKGIHREPHEDSIKDASDLPLPGSIPPSFLNNIWWWKRWWSWSWPWELLVCEKKNPTIFFQIPIYPKSMLSTNEKKH